MTLLIVLGCLIAGAGVIAGAQWAALGRKAALNASYQRDYYDGYDTARPRAG